MDAVTPPDALGIGQAAPASAGYVASPSAAVSPISVPLAELFTVAAEHERNGRLADADRLLGHILAAAPDQPDALHLSGIVAYRTGRRAQALALMERSIRHGVNTPLYWRNICEVYRVLGQLDAALHAARQAQALNPDDPVVLSNRALVHADRLEFEAAEACERQALSLDPSHAGAHFGLAEILLAQGRMAEGWEEYEWRFRMPGAAVNLPPAPRPPQWDGTPRPDGRLLLIADQGFGDVIQFGRFIPWVRERCPDLVFACGLDAKPILAQFGATRIARHWNELPPYDAFIPLSGLPRLFGATVATIPAAIPYINPEPARVEQWRRRLDALIAPGLRRIGIVWAGRADHPNDHRRSARLATLAPLFRLERAAFVSLQKGSPQAEVAGYFGAAPLTSLGPELASWSDTMAVLATLDAIVTVDTAVAHLAGALGRPVWVMLPHAAEWRWLAGRADSPWYPTAHLVRQPAPGRWEAVVAEVASALS